MSGNTNQLRSKQKRPNQKEKENKKKLIRQISSKAKKWQLPQISKIHVVDNFPNCYADTYTHKMTDWYELHYPSIPALSSCMNEHKQLLI